MLPLALCGYLVVVVVVILVVCACIQHTMFLFCPLTYVSFLYFDVMFVHCVQYGWTVLHFAAYNGHVMMVRALVERYNCLPDRTEKVCRVTSTV